MDTAPPPTPAPPPPPDYVAGDQFATVFAEEMRTWVQPASLLRARRHLPPGIAQPDVTAGLVGLALSGGGIRSATFALGAAQALARSNVLEQVDYLSTVSGGGYLGTAVSSLLHWSTPPAGPPPPPPASRHPLTAEAFPFRFGPFTSTGTTVQFKAERPPVRQLREMSNYLAPKIGLFDTQTWFALIRAVMLALLVLVLLALPPVILSLLALTAVPETVWRRANPLWNPAVVWWPLVGSGALLLVFGVTTLVPPVPQPSQFNWIHKVLLWGVLAGLAWAGFVFSVQLAWDIPDWYKATFGGGALGLIAAARWAYSKLGDLAQRLGGWGERFRAVIMKLLFGVLGYGVLVMLIAALYFVVDSLPPLTRWVLAVPFAALVVIGLTQPRVTSWLNATSLHTFYRDRLGDCYVQREEPNRLLTGRAADVPLGELQERQRAQGMPLGPYHLLGTALNMTGSTDVSKLDRKADAFVLSTLYSGGSGIGYARTALYPDLKLSSAMAISGSAFSPNQGSATSTSLAILLTLLNARLGYWLPNPRAVTGAAPLGATPALWLYWKEMFGRASSADAYVYLSDGGHFDNSGIYELVRRRCRYIIAIDGSGEPNPKDVRFGTIGQVSRLVRIDFGVDIQIDLAPVTPDADGITASTYALGRVVYPPAYPAQPDDERTGLLVYLRATLTREMDSPDLEHYKRANPIFPNHSTADQFFDEAQFEAYRALGYRIARSVFRRALNAGPQRELQPLCREWNERIMGF